MKKKSRLKTFLVIIGLVVVLFLVRYIALGGVFALLIWDSANAKVVENTDPALYNQFMGENADEEYRNKWGMDETIFPETITNDMNVLDYKMVYYNPWDAQYLSYLVVQYDEEQYAAEVERLTKYQSTEYLGYYGVTGFDEKYELLAISADDYQGFVYALTDNKDTIIYVELIFCNYFYDLDYKKYIKEEYLPVGFDATSDNPYREKMLAED